MLTNTPPGTREELGVVGTNSEVSFCGASDRLGFQVLFGRGGGGGAAFCVEDVEGREGFGGQSGASSFVEAGTEVETEPMSCVISLLSLLSSSSNSFSFSLSVITAGSWLFILSSLLELRLRLKEVLTCALTFL